MKTTPWRDTLSVGKKWVFFGSRTHNLANNDGFFRTSRVFSIYFHRVFRNNYRSYLNGEFYLCLDVNDLAGIETSLICEWNPATVAVNICIKVQVMGRFACNSQCALLIRFKTRTQGRPQFGWNIDMAHGYFQPALQLWAIIATDWLIDWFRLWGRYSAQPISQVVVVGTLGGGRSVTGVFAALRHFWKF